MIRFTAVGVLALALCLLSVSQGRAQEPGEGRTITYDEAVRMAVERNTQVARARSEARLQGEIRTREYMDFLPNLTLSSSGTRSFGRSFSQEEGQILSETTDFFGADISATLNLFDGFEKFASLKRAGLEEEASEHRLTRTRQDIVFQVVDQFTTLLQNRTLAEVRLEERDVQEELLQQVRGLVDVGRVPVSDLYRQQAARAEAQAALVEAQRQVELAETGIVQTLQLDPRVEYRFTAPALDEDPALPDSVTAADTVPPAGADTTGPPGPPGAADPVPSQDSLFTFDALLEAALDERPDLAAFERSVEARQQDVRAARSGYWPSISVSFGYGSDWSSSAFQPIPGTGSEPRVITVDPENSDEPVSFPVPGSGSDPELRRPDFLDQLDGRRGGSVRLSLSMPIFDRLQTDTEVEQANVALRNAEYDLRDRRQLVGVQIRQALLDFRSARAQLDATTQRLEAARRAWTAARRRYDLGAATFVELAQVRSEYVAARSARVRTRYDVARTRKLIEYYTGDLTERPPLFP